MKVSPPLEQEDVRQASRSWWERHPMDYLGYLNAPDLKDDAEARAFFNEIDGEFARAAYFAQPAGAPLFSGLIDYPSLRGKEVLEVGCGLGGISAELARQGAQVTAVDLTTTGVRATGERFSLEGLPGVLVQANAECLPFQDNYFDFVWSWGVLHHTPGTAAAMGEIRRVLRPGGKLGLMLYHRHSFYNWVNVIFRYGVLRLKLLDHSVPQLWDRYTDGKHIGGCPYVRYFSRGEVRQMLDGFELLETRAFEQKQAVLGLVPSQFRRGLERSIPDAFYKALFSRFGFLLFCQARKL